MNAARPINRVWYDNLPTPIGQLRLVADEQGLREVWFETGRHQREPASSWTHSPQALTFARVQLEEYFAGKRQVFELPLHPLGTPFQLAVWQELARIPYGATISYGELARRIGRPAASRAVGRANATNPIALIVPCHRVIGSNGTLTGYGGGLDLKAKLIAWEQSLAGTASPFLPGCET